MKKKILIIEDDAEEASYAQYQLAKAGVKNSMVIATLSGGLEVMPEYDAILTDLFFPAGNTSTKKYSQRFLPLYESYREKRFPKLQEDNVILRAVQKCAETFGISPEEYIENFMSKVYNPPSVLKLARDAVAGVRDSERYERFLKIEERIRNGTALPLGIIASERAKELNRPIVMVTSTHHHDDAFEPVRDLIRVPYLDRLVKGRKDWDGGIEFVLK